MEPGYGRERRRKRATLFQEVQVRRLGGQRARSGRAFCPSAHYTGPEHREFVPIEQRG
jgi:hypothetical protein